LSDAEEPRGPIERARRTLHMRLQLLRLLRQASPGLVAATVVTAVLAGLMPVAFIVAGGSLSARIQDALAAGGSPASLRAVYGAFAMLIGLFLISEVMVPVQSRLRWLVMKRVDGAARKRVMHATLQATDMARLHNPDFLHSMRRLRGLVWYSATPGGGAAGMIGVLRDYLVGFAAAVAMAFYQPLVALAVLLVALTIRVQWRAEVIRLINTWIDGVPFFHEAGYFAELGLGRKAANEVRLFGLRDWITRRIHAAGIRGWTPTWSQRILVMRRPMAIHLVLSSGAGFAALLWAARASIAGNLDVAQLVVFVPALFTVLALARSFDDDIPVEYGTVILPALETIERLAAEAVARERGRISPSDSPPRVELRDVSFRYPETESDVLDRVSIVVPAGGSAALVGINGAGKTTLVRLLCGLYSPQRGSVLVDGEDLRDLDLDEWHRRIAPMFQEFLRLQLSVAENVGAGAVERIGDEEDIRGALREAGAMAFAERLPDGLDSLLATKYADGSDLSGGQWQRLAIARALFALRGEAQLLILDEPTSNLDTSSEERLVRRLIEETRGIATTLLVTHRLAVARRTDRIFVIEGGRVLEQGTHDELLLLDGKYAAAFKMQAALYPLGDPTDA
jgi:ATP-binding cassette, subfamily B, bacterial